MPLLPPLVHQMVDEMIDDMIDQITLHIESHSPLPFHFSYAPSLSAYGSIIEQYSQAMYEEVQASMASHAHSHAFREWLVANRFVASSPSSHGGRSGLTGEAPPPCNEEGGLSFASLPAGAGALAVPPSGDDFDSEEDEEEDVDVEALSEDEVVVVEALGVEEGGLSFASLPAGAGALAVPPSGDDFDKDEVVVEALGIEEGGLSFASLPAGAGALAVPSSGDDFDSEEEDVEVEDLGEENDYVELQALNATLLAPSDPAPFGQDGEESMEDGPEDAYEGFFGFF